MPRFQVKPETAVWLLALYAATVLNIPFWRRMWRVTEPASVSEWLFLLVVFIDLVGLLALFFGLFSVRGVLKWIGSILLLSMAAASYYMLEYGTVFDREMIRNVFETDTAEASELLSWRLAAFLIVLGVVPAILLWRTELTPRPLKSELRFRAITGAIAAVMMVAISLPFAASFSSIVRGNGALRYEVNPFNYLFGMANYARQSQKTRRIAAIASPVIVASKQPVWQSRNAKSLLVVVVGETARAKNFSLLGYDKPTNPRLAAIPELIAFSNTFSCGTFTAQSLPCMFSSLGREKFTIEDAKSHPGLIETLKTAGFHMLWRNNNSGCKDVCNVIPNETVGPPRKQFYDGNLPTDDVLLEGLDPWLDAIDRPSVLWLHMRGSHGPAYFRRYPPEFERFKPTCQDTRFSKCTVESVVNAYDNTILYTDHVLAELIERLKARAPVLSTAMLYVSDHGESLGENNMYLHGAPYAFAPDTQKHVPMFVWSSQAFARETALDVACLASKRAAPTSHDNLYHSILGLMDTATSSYDRGKDIFAPCRRTS